MTELFAAKKRLEDHMGVSLSTSEYSFLAEYLNGDPLLTRQQLNMLLEAYLRGHDAGYEQGRLDWQGEPV